MICTICNGINKYVCACLNRRKIEYFHTLHTSINVITVLNKIIQKYAQKYASMINL